MNCLICGVEFKPPFISARPMCPNCKTPSLINEIDTRSGLSNCAHCHSYVQFDDQWNVKLIKAKYKCWRGNDRDSSAVHSGD